MSLKKVKSADGTLIAFEAIGNGPVVILVGGAFNDRSGRTSGTPLAALLSSRFKAVSYDRRGRGDSQDAPHYAVDREVDDLAVLITEMGGSAFVYGMSSGAVLALEAAARQLPITKLALYEPPLMLDSERAKGGAALAQELERATAEGRRADAVDLFLTKVMQMPPPVIANMRKSPMWSGLESLSHTLSYDMHITTQGPSLIARASSVKAEVLAMVGDSCAPWMAEAIRACVDAVPSGHYKAMPGQTHDVDIKALADVLGAFFGS